MRYLTALLLLVSSLSWSAPSVWLYDETTDNIIITQDSSQTRPIASITKLMTAVVTLEYDKDLDRRILVAKGSRLPSGYHRRHDVLTAMLVKSDNVAAVALSKDYPGGTVEFVKTMNRRAQNLGMHNTSFEDPSGIGRGNVSTAREVGMLLQMASTFEPIRQISPQKQVQLDNVITKTTYKKKGQRVVKTYPVTLDNTNRVLLYDLSNVVVSKTGFTNPAGFCVGMVFETNTNKFMVVVLGARDKAVRRHLALDAVHSYVSNAKSITKNPEPKLVEFTYPI